MARLREFDEERALDAAVRKGSIGGVILDVWEGEPRIDYALLERVDIGIDGLDIRMRLDGMVSLASEMRQAA